jgi:hypothetical protein
VRNVFLTLVLANLLLLAWQFWVEPGPAAPAVPGPNDLVLFDAAPGPTPGPPLASRPGGSASEPGMLATAPAGTCWRVGPLPDVAAAQQASQRLTARGIDATAIARDSQLWLGHWVQIGGFPSVAAAESARQRLVAGGLADAYLMQDGAEPMISLGVFRDRGRADRVAGEARTLGFEVSIRDRYRPAVEQWLLIRPRPGRAPELADLSQAGDRIMRTESAPCDLAGASLAPATEPATPEEPRQTL